MSPKQENDPPSAPESVTVRLCPILQFPRADKSDPVTVDSLADIDLKVDNSPDTENPDPTFA